MEKLSFIGAAQRLGVSVEEVKKMIEEKKLKEVGRGKVSKEAVYALSGLNATGKQTKRSPGRKPNVMTFEAAADYLCMHVADIKELVESGDIEVVEGTGGVRGPRESMVKMYGKKIEGRDETVSPPQMRTAKAGPIPEVRREEEDNIDDYIPLLGGEDADTETEEKSTEIEEPAGTDDIPASGSSVSAEDMEVEYAADPTAQEEEHKKEAKKDTEDKGETDFKETSMNLDEIMKSIFPGIQRLDPDMMKSIAKQCECDKPQFSRKDMKEVADVAYMKGKLSVYESMSEFKRKVGA